MTLPNDFPLTRIRTAAICDALADKAIAVAGDFHLDVYWHADMRQARLSRETPHFARPVVREAYYPGVGGVIAANLCALGVGKVYAVGASGDDWRGAVLRRQLAALGVQLDYFREVPGRVTPTYIKPMIEGYESVQEDPRLDFQDDRDLPAQAEEGLCRDLTGLAGKLDGLVVIDQIEDETGGVVSAGVRQAVSQVAKGVSGLPVVADSRARIQLFRQVAVKVNRLELSRALDRDIPEDRVALLAGAAELGAVTSGDVFVSAGAEGMGFAGRSGDRGHVCGVAVTGPVDTVGAGDSASAGLISALACGAGWQEAAAFANLVASITVRKIGVTGTASRAELMNGFA